LVRAGLETLPVIIRAQGERTSRRSIESLPHPSVTAIPEWRTRAAKQFFDWCDGGRLKLEDFEAIPVATYIEQLSATPSNP
jgi:hypothetical protein